MGSLHTMLHVRDTICEFTELVHHHGILYSISSDQGIHFTANEVQQWTHDHGIH